MTWYGVEGLLFKQKKLHNNNGLNMGRLEIRTLKKQTKNSFLQVEKYLWKKSCTLVRLYKVRNTETKARMCIEIWILLIMLYVINWNGTVIYSKWLTRINLWKPGNEISFNEIKNVVREDIGETK